MIVSSKGLITGGTYSSGGPVLPTLGNYVFSNIYNTYQTWAVTLPVKPLWVGAKIIGVSSGATGIITYYDTDLIGKPSSVKFLKTSVANFTGSETINLIGGGSMLLAAAYTASVSINTMLVSGTDDSDITTNMIKDLGTYGARGGKLVTTFSAEVPAIEYGGSQSVSFVDGSTIAVSEIFQVGDTDELISILTKPTANTATVRRGYLDPAIYANAPVILAGTSLYRVSLTTSGATGMKVRGFYRIEDEYIYVTYTSGATSWIVERGMLGSTMVEHTANKDIHILSENFLYQCYAASVINGWGYDSVVNGIMRLDCMIFIGTPDSSARCICLTANEALIQTGTTFACGSNITTNRSWCQVGKGIVGEARSAFEGCVWLSRGTDSISGYGSVSTKFGKIHRFNSNLEVVSDHDGGSIHDCTLSSTTSGAFALASVYGNSWFDGSDTTYWHDVLTTAYGLNPGSARIDFNRIINKDCSIGFYFVQGFASPEIWDAQVVNCEVDAFAFIDVGDKIFINSEIDVFNMGGFWASPTYYDKRTLDMSAITPDSVDVPGVNVRIWDVFGTLVVNETTGVDGTIPQQQVTIKTNAVGTATLTAYNPFKIIVTKKGWKDKDFLVNITTALVYEFVMENPGLVEDEN